MVKGKTKSGFTFTADEEVLKTWGFIEQMAWINTGDARGLAKFRDTIDSLLGAGQFEKLEEHCKDDKGHAFFDAIWAEFDEIVGIVKDKNSEAKN